MTSTLHVENGRNRGTGEHSLRPSAQAVCLATAFGRSLRLDPAASISSEIVFRSVCCTTPTTAQGSPAAVPSRGERCRLGLRPGVDAPLGFDPEEGAWS